MARSARSYQREADQLRAQGWTYRQIAALWRQRYGVNFRVAFRLAYGMTQADVADRWNEQWPDAESPKTAKHISYWEIWPGPAGRAPSLDALNKLAFLYRCNAGDLLDGEDYSHLDPLDNASDPAAPLPSGQITPALAPTPNRVTEQVVADFERLTDTYRQMDYRDGSRRVAGDAVRHLRRMLEASNRTTNSRTHRRLLLAAGDAAQLVAWLAIDAQRYDEARSYCRTAVSLATQANDRALHAYSLGVISYIHLHAGDGRAALDVLGAARGIAGRSAPAAVRSWLSEAAGEAHGLVSEQRHGLTALAEAERTFDGVTPGNTPAWLTFFNADCHAARLKGRCLASLERPEDATKALFEALTLLPASFVRERSGTLIDLAVAYVQMHQIEQACVVAAEADVLARSTASERNRRRLRHLLVDLLPWAGEEPVQRLYHQVLLN